MIILGIDPGCIITGFSVIKKDHSRIFLLDAGIFKFSSKASLSKRVGLFYKLVEEKIKMHNVKVIALETPFLGKNAQSFLKLGYLRGIIYLLADYYNLELHEFSPREIKQSITGFGGAAKDQIARVIIRLFPNFSMPLKFDITDAIAIALCGSFKIKIALAH